MPTTETTHGKTEKRIQTELGQEMFHLQIGITYCFPTRRNLILMVQMAVNFIGTI